MNKLFLLLLVLFISLYLSAFYQIESDATVIVRRDLSASSCPTGTYIFAWDGDHDDGPEYACDSVGTSIYRSSTAGTYATGTSYGRTGTGLMIDDQNQWLKWDVSGDNYFSEDIGTFWIDIRAVLTSGNNQFLEADIDDGATGNKLWCWLAGSGNPRCQWTGSNSSVLVNTTTNISDNTWTTIGVSWEVGATSNDISITWCTDDTCYDWDTNVGTTSTDLTDWSSEPDQFVFGDDLRGDDSVADELHFDNIYFTNTYRANNPLL